jgi:hypothetical protein
MPPQALHGGEGFKLAMKLIYSAQKATREASGATASR